jgi:hypothetical protein
MLRVPSGNPFCGGGGRSYTIRLVSSPLCSLSRILAVANISRRRDSETISARRRPKAIRPGLGTGRRRPGRSASAMSKNLAAVRLHFVIRRRLAAYLVRKQSIRTFWRWFVPAVWEVNDLSWAPLREMVFAIKLRVDDYSNGGISENQLREALRPFVTNMTLEQKGSSENVSILRHVDWLRQAASSQSPSTAAERPRATVSE